MADLKTQIEEVIAGELSRSIHSSTGVLEVWSSNHEGSGVSVSSATVEVDGVEYDVEFSFEVTVDFARLSDNDEDWQDDDYDEDDEEE